VGLISSRRDAPSAKSDPKPGEAIVNIGQQLREEGRREGECAVLLRLLRSNKRRCRPSSNARSDPKPRNHRDHRSRDREDAADYSTVDLDEK